MNVCRWPVHGWHARHGNYNFRIGTVLLLVDEQLISAGIGTPIDGAQWVTGLVSTCCFRHALWLRPLLAKTTEVTAKIEVQVCACFVRGVWFELADGVHNLRFQLNPAASLWLRCTS